MEDVIENKYELYNGDCLEIIKNIKSKSIDLVIIDPPYKQKINSTGSYKGKLKREYFNEISGISNGIENIVLEELCRVMKKINIYIWCNKEQIGQYIDFFKGRGCMMDLLTWHKTNPSPFCNNRYLSDTEYLLFFREHGVKIYGEYNTKKKYYITQTNKIDKKIYKHPTIKPLDITENIIKNSSCEKDLILDCYMGTGTTIVGAIKNNRKAIGIELDDNYFNIAKERIEKYIT